MCTYLSLEYNKRKNEYIYIHYINLQKSCVISYKVRSEVEYSSKLQTFYSIKGFHLL